MADPDSGCWPLLYFVVALTSAATVATNQFHKWRTQGKGFTFARWRTHAARFGTATSQTASYPALHTLLHHQRLAQSALNRVNFFRRLEATLALSA